MNMLEGRGFNALYILIFVILKKKIRTVKIFLYVYDQIINLCKKKLTKSNNVYTEIKAVV